MTFAFLERLCAALDHRFEPLCGYVVRHDHGWRDYRVVNEHHCERRRIFLGGAEALPFPAGAPHAVMPPEAVAPESVRNREPARQQARRSA